MTTPGERFGRADNKTKFKMMIADDENPMEYAPFDAHINNKYFGMYNKIIRMNGMIDLESKEKYLWRYAAKSQAKHELGDVPKCFDQCIAADSLDMGLNSVEKNCMRECYFKRVSIRDELTLYYQGRIKDEYVKNVRNNWV